MKRIRDIYAYNFFVAADGSRKPKFALWKEYKKGSENPLILSDFTKVIKETNKEIVNELIANPDGVYLSGYMMKIKLILQKISKDYLKRHPHVRKYTLHGKYYPMIEFTNPGKHNNMMKFWKFSLQERLVRRISDELRTKNFYDFKVIE